MGPIGLPLGASKTAPGAVLFDKDGTLCRSDSYLFALAQARASYCAQLAADASLEALLLRAYGVTATGLRCDGATAVASRHDNLISTATVLAAAGHSWGQARHWASEALQQADRQWADRKPQLTPPTPGLYSLLERLQAADLQLAIISSDLGDNLEAFLAEYQLRHYFQAVHGADRPLAKPNPAAAQALCQELGLAPAQCGIIGDAQDDLTMAAAAGLGWSLAYTGGWDPAPVLTGSHGHIQHWDQLAPL
ncbi:MAG: hypothetical protein RLZZ158_2000 [Cyanobacteriota bacterium]|jgi:phosphoglycolate phosphatase